MVLGVLLAIFVILTIVFAALYGVEKSRESHARSKELFVRNFQALADRLASDELCLTPYCIEAGLCNEFEWLNWIVSFGIV